MTRVMTFVLSGLVCVLVGVPTSADDPPKKLTAEERRQQAEKWKELTLAGLKALQNNKQADAQKAFEDALPIARQLYGKADYPNGHPNLAVTLNSLGALYRAQGRLADAEPFLRDALDVFNRLYKGQDRADVALCMFNLARVYKAQGKLIEAVPLFESTLKMKKKLLKGMDAPDVAECLNALADLYRRQRKLAQAEVMAKDGLAMDRRLHNGKDHLEVAQSLTTLAHVYWNRGKPAEAEPLCKEALEMRLRMFKDRDHILVASSQQNLGQLYLAQGKWADAEPLLKAALEMSRRLFADNSTVASSAETLAMLYHAQGKLSDAEPLMETALAMYRRLAKGDDDPRITVCSSNLAALYQAMGKLAEAERLLKGVLDMYTRRSNGKDSPEVATSMNNLSNLYAKQGKLSAAEPLLKAALEMKKRLVENDDHRDVALYMSNLGALYWNQQKPADAEPLLKDALAMYRRLFNDRDLPNIAVTLGNIGIVNAHLGKHAEADAASKAALEMDQRLYKGQDHPAVAGRLNNLGALYRSQGKLAEAEALLKDALAMYRRLARQQDHPVLAAILNNLGCVYLDQGKFVESETVFKAALEMNERLMTRYARQKSEGEALTLGSSAQLSLDALLSVARARVAADSTYDPAAAYPAVWTRKGMFTRVYQERLLRSRAAASDPALVKTLDQLAGARRRRAEALLAPVTKDPGTLKKREEELTALEKTIGDLQQSLLKRLPAVARTAKLDMATVSDLQKAIPADAALVDYVRFTHFEWDNGKPVGEKEKRTSRYAAFVITRETVTWVDLDTASAVELAVSAWREAITGDATRSTAPASVEVTAERGATVRKLVWDKVRKSLPGKIKSVFVCPDADLCKVPFAALPGDKPDTIVLEDYALATVPHAPFLLDHLWPQDPPRNPPTRALVVGGVKYDAEPPVLKPIAISIASRGEPLLKPGQNPGWSFLANTVGESNGVAESAVRKSRPVTRIDGDKATTVAVLAALPEARYAHFATHGFFSDATFRSVFQLDENEYRQESWGERRGRIANSPLLMTGLVFAGANNPKAPGRGVLTGEQIVDLDLSGLELAVLSACETGLGHVAGGEGTFGLQRAFHYAGARNVVCSLWKVPDAPTAALMNLFYTNLWDKNLSPIESLRQAQLQLYRNPGKIPELAKGFRGKFEVVPGMGGEVEVKPTKTGKAHPLLWAAFSLSGLGK